MVALGWKTWQEAALYLFAEKCSKCSAKTKEDYKTCESRPAALTIHRMTSVCVDLTGDKKNV